MHSVSSAFDLQCKEKLQSNMLASDPWWQNPIAILAPVCSINKQFITHLSSDYSCLVWADGQTVTYKSLRWVAKPRTRSTKLNLDIGWSLVVAVVIHKVIMVICSQSDSGDFLYANFDVNEAKYNGPLLDEACWSLLTISILLLVLVNRKDHWVSEQKGEWSAN